jgi:hypothetical protein
VWCLVYDNNIDEEIRSKSIGSFYSSDREAEEFSSACHAFRCFSVCPMLEVNGRTDGTVLVGKTKRYSQCNRTLRRKDSYHYCCPSWHHNCLFHGRLLLSSLQLRMVDSIPLCMCVCEHIAKHKGTRTGE